MSNTPMLVRRSQLGELLLAEGKLSREELEAALAYREERGLKLGQALVALHLVTQQDLTTALRSQGRIHCLHLTAGIIETEVAIRLPEAMARQYVAVPVHRVAGRITVAMEDPCEEYDVAAITLALGEPVFAVHAEPERILEAIARLYPHGRVRAPSAPDAPRFTLVRGPLPDKDPDEAAELLVRAALREAHEMTADSFHVECTERGTEMSFRIGGTRTRAALLTADWASPCANALIRLAGGPPNAQRAARSIELEGIALDIDVAVIAGHHGPCARIALATAGPALRLEDLELTASDIQVVESALAAGRGLLLVAGTFDAENATLAEDLVSRSASAGRRVYRLGAKPGLPGTVSIPRDAHLALADQLHSIADQAPDVVDVGPVAGSAAWNAVMALVRAGSLVVAHVDAPDAAAALASVFRCVDDPAEARDLCLGALAQRRVRLACPKCHAEDADAAASIECPQCSGVGCVGTTRIAEFLEIHSAVRERLGDVRERLDARCDADSLRAAALALGFTDMRARGHELVVRGLTNARELDRAWNRWALNRWDRNRQA